MKKKLTTANNGLELQSRVCPLCGDVPYQIVGSGYDYDYRTTFHVFEYRRCRQCSVVYPDYEPVHGQLDKVYTQSYWHDTSKIVYRTSLKRQLQFRAGRLIKRLSYLATEKPRFKLLDIGSGRGDLFWILRDKFPDGEYYSVDLTYDIELPGVKHYKGYFEDCDFAGQEFDVITSQHSIEHVYSPRDYLSKAASLLNDDGFIFIATPNVDALEFRIFRKKLYCAGYSVPRHLSLFNERSFRILVDSTQNLQVEKLNYFFTIHHWAGMIHHIAYDKTRSDKTDRYLNYNNVFLSVPLYLFDLARYWMGFKTGVLEAVLTKASR